MTLKQARRLDYGNLCYSQFLLTSVIYKRLPFRCLAYDSDSKTTTLVIFSRTQGGTVVTRHIRLVKESANDVIRRLESDFDIITEFTGQE